MAQFPFEGFYFSVEAFNFYMLRGGKYHYKRNNMR